MRKPAIYATVSAFMSGWWVHALSDMIIASHIFKKEMWAFLQCEKNLAPVIFCKE